MSPERDDAQGEGALAAEFLHDTVGPAVSAIGLQLDLLRMDYAGDRVLAGRLDAMQTTIEALMSDIRLFVNQLNAGGPSKP
jgi:signal transduction histidine kinase